jgi:Uma2 family endonuclease
MSTAARKIAPALPPEMTVEEWADMPEDDPGELVDGQLVEEEVPDDDHEAIALWIASMFLVWVLPRGGFAAASEAKFALGPKHGRKPDVSVYLPGGAVPEAQGPVYARPDIMVEVISRDPRDMRRDRIDKSIEYAAFGVQFYWLVDPRARMVEVYELQPGGAYLRIVAASSGTMAVPGCADLTLDLDGMWTYVGRLAPVHGKVTRLRTPLKRRKTAKK